MDASVEPSTRAEGSRVGPFRQSKDIARLLRCGGNISGGFAAVESNGFRIQDACTAAGLTLFFAICFSFLVIIIRKFAVVFFSTADSCSPMVCF